ATDRLSKEADSGYPPEFDPEVQNFDAMIREIRERSEEPQGGRGFVANPKPAAAAGRARGGLTKTDFDAMRPYVIDLNQGFFTSGEGYTTATTDVDKLFADLLTRAQQAQAAQKTMTLLFYAHGGLVDKESGLAQALEQIPWWTQNGVYPIFFVWETGFWNTVEHLLTGIQQRSLAAGSRGFTDAVTDPILEKLARSLGGPKIWGGMKRSAEVAAQPQTAQQAEGGARYVARKLCDLLKQFPSIELHALGHSAGAIFHADFLNAVVAIDPTVRFKSLQLMAPAITVASFKDRLLPLLRDESVGGLAMYAMRKDLEMDDNCAGIYRKSLLYLIYHALEDQPEVDLLGLEESVWRDADLKALFGLDGTADPLGKAIWSQTPPGGDSASRSTSHGGFHSDWATMASILQRIRKLDPNAPLQRPAWLTDGGRGLAAQQPSVVSQFAAVAAGNSSGVAVPAFQAGLRGARSSLAGTGRRRALCVGINAYGGANTLYGCVADAQLWAQTLNGLGFDVQTLVDATASYAGITSALQNLIAESTAGDVVVFQYAGHGTEIPDTEGRAEPDQAIVPIDYDESGAFIIDKDLNRIFGTTPAGVNLTCFFDSCNSGDLDRLFIAGGPLVRPRFIKLTAAQVAKYHQFASRRGIDRRSLATRGELSVLKDISFAACQSDQSAYESNGQGDFTLRTTNLLRQGLPALSNRQFCDQIVAAFGASPRQLPRLDGATGSFGLPLLAPLQGASPQAVDPRAAGTAAPIGRPGDGAVPLHLLSQGLRQLADLLDTERG
ncbi:MAG TPA: caspase family protein, partial [Thermoanaerobaculia bacterium]|nr:caspase family protein [Thermoanaerobaculia bacterium]